MSDLEYITTSPPNAGVPMTALDGRPLPQDRAYLRNSFPIPESAEDVVDVLLPGIPQRSLSVETLADLEQVEVEWSSNAPATAGRWSRLR